MDPSSEQPPQPDQEMAERFEIFKLIQRLAQDNPDANKRIVKTYSTGAVDSEDIARLLEGKPFVDMKELLKGDVLSLATQSGSMFYFRINEGIDEDHPKAKGDLRRINKDGESTDYPDVILQGSALGHALAANKIFLNGLSAQFRRPSEVDRMTNEEKDKLIEEKGPEALMPKMLITSPLVDAQIIRSETIQPQPPSND